MTTKIKIFLFSFILTVFWVFGTVGTLAGASTPHVFLEFLIVSLAFFILCVFHFFILWLKKETINPLAIFLPFIPFAIYKLLNLMAVLVGVDPGSFMTDSMLFFSFISFAIVTNYFITKTFIHWHERASLFRIITSITVFLSGAFGVSFLLYMFVEQTRGVLNVVGQNILPSSSYATVFLFWSFAASLSAFINTLIFAFRRPRTRASIIFGSLMSLYLLAAVSGTVLVFFLAAHFD